MKIRTLLLASLILFTGFYQENLHAMSSLGLPEFFNRLNKDTMSLVDEFYDEKIVFVDPVVTLTSREAIKTYYSNQYQNLISIKFDFESIQSQGDEQMAVWKMTMCHKALQGGRPIVVDGMTHLRLKNGKVVYHHDYFDMGVFIYENIPLLGRLVKFVKKKLHP
ncbi:MAG: nuclear transport factor 2 family protein [Spirochaetia bacterium]|nr:nuclear transport factor 2 family protein [Spirochaetia bacterium]